MHPASLCKYFNLMVITSYGFLKLTLDWVEPVPFRIKIVR